MIDMMAACDPLEALAFGLQLPLTLAEDEEMPPDDQEYQDRGPALICGLVHVSAPTLRGVVVYVHSCTHIASCIYISKRTHVYTNRSDGILRAQLASACRYARFFCSGTKVRRPG